ncbi:MAG: hypothetical protein WD876_01215 [Candidatus Pacearchaeota archaeon]
MTQNRNKIIELFIGNISNAIVHEILEKAASKEFMTDKYRKELITSFEIAKRYREKINPVNKPLPNKDVGYIRNKIINKVRAELMMRISKGYENIEFNLIEELVDTALKNTNIK